MRFLRWPNGNLDNTPEEYQMVVNLFGATSSPSVCGYALLQVAVDNESTASPEAIRTSQKSFYVDDLLISFGSEDEAVEIL